MLFEPGSTLKPFIISAALKKGILPSAHYDGLEGQISIDGHVIREAESTHKFEEHDFEGNIILFFQRGCGASGFRCR